ncbi:MAG: phosphoribosylglycinamide formyltransferase [Pseudomonadota bacterium]
MTRVAILISGSGSNMVRLVEALRVPDSPAVPALVLSNVPGVAGLVKAAALGVPATTVDHRRFAKDRAAFEAAVDRALRESHADLLCLAGFMRILTAGFVERWAGRILNIHPSLLPKYRGLDTHARVLAAGDPEHGCTVHLVTPELDDGPILGQAKLTVRAEDTPETLAARVQALEHRLYPTVLARYLAGEKAPLLLC